MAQHTPIEAFRRKDIKRIENSIRKERGFKGSLKYQNLEHIVGRWDIEDFKESPDDMVFTRQLPKSIFWFRPDIEIHTRPDPDSRHRRIATNIYIVA